MLSWLYIVGLGTVSTALAFTLFLHGLQIIGPVSAAIITTAEPFFVAILAALVLGQPIQLQTIVGGTLIAIAVLVLQRRVHR
jgi:drug/metabolite transporter (DMT)-like permease